MVQHLPHARAQEAVEALCDSFHDYPVMRYILSTAGENYDRDLHTLIGMFVAARVSRGAPILVVERDGVVAGVATITRPEERIVPPANDPAREAVWKVLGSDAKERGETLRAAWDRHLVPDPQYHLNMLGVRRTYAGQGLGRALLDAVHELSRQHAQSVGVSLTTEDPKNVPLYQHFGYEVVGHERVAGVIDTWSFFRPDRASDRSQ